MEAIEQKLGQETAFPFFAEPYGSAPIIEYGMSKRFYAACCAMQGLLANSNIVDNNCSDGAKWVAQHALMLADELLKQENL